MVKLTQKRLKGATLVETLVAMVIITLAMVLSTQLYIQVVQHSKQQSRTELSKLLDEMAFNTWHNNAFLDEEVNYKKYVLSKSFTGYNGSKDLFLLKLTAKDENGLIVLEKKKLLVSNE